MPILSFTSVRFLKEKLGLTDINMAARDMAIEAAVFQ